MPTAIAVKNKQISHQFSLIEAKRIHSFDGSSFVQPISLESRRYIGCKQKLVDWIFEIIQKETENIKTATDIFAGTGVVAKRMLGLYQNVIINDFLFSNNVIYKAFFEKSEWSKKKNT